MLRDEISDLLKQTLKGGDTVATATLRLMRAAIKDGDIARRTAGEQASLSDDDIRKILVTMVKQRRESIEAYRKGGRVDLAEREQQEIDVIERFLPKQMSKTDTQKVVKQAVKTLEASSLKDMGKVMAALRAAHPHEMDFALAGSVARKILSGETG
ncbi:MAG: GatB/YqeY domain-containing protein [Pseudomonadota bacterium]